MTDLTDFRKTVGTGSAPGSRWRIAKEILSLKQVSFLSRQIRSSRNLDMKNFQIL